VRAPKDAVVSWRGRPAWLVAGFVVLVVVCAVALPNLAAIYASQTDFVLGGLLSLVGFCFGKAFGRSDDERAVELIRTHHPAVLAALEAELTDKLHRDGVFEDIAVLERDIVSTVQRLSQYYDAQARRPNFLTEAGLLDASLGDLDHASAVLRQVRRHAGQQVEEPPPAQDLADRVLLETARRYLAEGAGRAEESRALLENGSPLTGDAWEIFAVAVSDLVKALRRLDATLGRSGAFPLPEELYVIGEYVEAARRRAAEFDASLLAGGTTRPALLLVMYDDLAKASSLLVGLQRKRAAPGMESIYARDSEALPDGTPSAAPATDGR
jgi:hypothetical protein